MSELNFYINNILSPPPNNWENLTVELEFENDSPDASIRTGLMEWSGAAAKTVNTTKTSGLQSGKGIYEGDALRIDVCDPPVNCFDGCIDPTTPDTLFTCDVVKAGARDNRIEYVSKRSEAYTFRYLFDRPIGSPGRITSADYVKVPYVRTAIPDYEQVAILGLSFVEMFRIVNDTYQMIQETISDITGMIANVPPTPVALALKILTLIAQILYTILLILILIRLFLLIVSNIIQPIKYKYAMKCLTLFQRAAASLGLSFSSTILQNPSSIYYNSTIMPEKYAAIQQANFLDTFFGSTISRRTYDDAQNLNSAIPSKGYPSGSLKKFFMDMCKDCEAKISVRGTTMYFERWDYWFLNPGVVLPPISSEAPFENPYGTNADELTGTYAFKRMLDPSDFNTFDRIDGTFCHAVFTPNTVINERNVLLDGLTEIQSSFALAKYKDSLTFPEKVLNVISNIIQVFVNVLNTIINAANAITGNNNQNPAVVMNPIQARIGCLLLENDFTSVPKIMIVNPPNARGVSYLSPNNQAYTSAESMQNNFHNSRWLIKPNGQSNNQFLVYKNQEIPLCCSDFKKIRDNNIITTHDGKLGRIDSLQWNPHFQTARIDYRVRELFYTNVSVEVIVDGE